MSSVQRKKRKKKGDKEVTPVFTRPPDNYKSVKTSLKKILKDDIDEAEEVLERIENAVMKTHQITILAYQFIRLYMLHKYHLGLLLPTLDEKFMLLCLKTIAIGDKRGPPLKKETKIIKDELDDFYERVIKPINHDIHEMKHDIYMLQKNDVD